MNSLLNFLSFGKGKSDLLDEDTVDSIYETIKHEIETICYIHSQRQLINDSLVNDAEAISALSKIKVRLKLTFKAAQETDNTYMMSSAMILTALIDGKICKIEEFYDEEVEELKQTMS